MSNIMKRFIKELERCPSEIRERNSVYNPPTFTIGIKNVTITNKCLASIEAKKSMLFECPNCKHTQIKKAWNYVHKFCPHCGAKISWELSE